MHTLIADNEVSDFLECNMDANLMKTVGSLWFSYGKKYTIDILQFQFKQKVEKEILKRPINL